LPPSESTSCDVSYVIVAIGHRDTAIQEIGEVPPSGLAATPPPLIMSSRG